MISLEVGKIYWTRGGGIVDIVSVDYSKLKPFTGRLWTRSKNPAIIHFYVDGTRRSEQWRHDYGVDFNDLIEEVTTEELYDRRVEQRSRKRDHEQAEADRGFAGTVR